MRPSARAHGASRPLHDIDLYVPEGALEPLRAQLAEHVRREPSRHRDEHWDCYFMKVDREDLEELRGEG